MTRAEHWALIQHLWARNEDVASIRALLLNEFTKPEPYAQPFHACAKENLRQILAAVKPFLFCGKKSSPTPRPILKTGLPLLLLPYATGSNLLNLLPVAIEARNRKMLGLLVASGNVTEQQLANFDQVITERELWRIAREHGLLKTLQSASRKYKGLLTVMEKADPIYARRVRQNAGNIFKQMVISEAMSNAYRRLLSEWKPSCVVSTSDYWPFEFQLFSEAQRAGIPNAMIQHGELNDVLSWPPFAETFLVWGSAFQEKLFKLGAPANRVQVCGMPAAHALFNRATHARPKPVNAASPVCLVLSHTQDRIEEPATYRSFARFLKETIPAMPHVEWQIRLHPSEDESFYREQGWVGNARVHLQSRGISLETAVAEADVICTIRSTAGLQAMMLQRPVVVLDLTPECVWWPSQGGGKVATDSNSFKNIFDRLIDDVTFRTATLESQRGFLNQSFANKGKAASSIVDYMEEQTRLRSADCKIASPA